MAQYREEWRTSGTGPLTNGVANQIGWIRVPRSDPIWKEVPVDPAAGRTSAHVELFFTVRTCLSNFAERCWYADACIAEQLFCELGTSPSPGQFHFALHLADFA